MAAIYTSVAVGKEAWRQEEDVSCVFVVPDQSHCFLEARTLSSRRTGMISRPLTCSLFAVSARLW